MRNYIIPFIFTIITLVSCDEEPILYSEGAYVAFTSGNSVLAETNTSTSVELYRSATDVSEPLTVNLTVTSKYLETTDFADEGDDASETFRIFSEAETVTFPAGVSRISIPVYSLNDVFSSGNKEVTLTITGVSDDTYNLGLPGPDSNRKSTIILIEDDDCPIDLATDWVGTYSVDYCGSEGAFNEGACVLSSATATATLTVDATDESGTTVLLSSTSFSEPVRIKFNTCPETAEMLNELVVLGPYWIVEIDAASKAFYGTGTFDPDAKKIIVYTDMTNSANANYGEFDFTFTKID